MKLIHPDFLVEIPCNENKITNIVIESPSVFQQYIGELYEQIEGKEGAWVLSEGGVPLELKKVSEMIINPYGLNINNKKILGKLYESIKKDILQSDRLIEWNELLAGIHNFLESLFSDYDYFLDYAEEIDVKEVLKIMNVAFNENEGGRLERLIDYCNLHQQVLGTTVFILVNIKSYFSLEQLQYLYEEAFYKKFYLIIIENKEYSIDNEQEIRYIIDEDQCVIQK